MKGKYILILCWLFLFSGFSTSAQNKYEREYRIRKVQFPEKASAYIQEKLVDAKRIRFYKETDNSIVSYEAKFKKDRLWYGIEFDAKGVLKGIQIRVKSIDIPDEAFEKMNTYLKNNFAKYRIRKIQQRYPVNDLEKVEATVKSAFQNLILPTINYELIVAGTKENNFDQYEVLFDAEGNFKSVRKSLPPNYDHVLY